MTTIIGVDFSGAIAERPINTWAAQGRLNDRGALQIDSACRIRRADLYRLLADSAVPAVAAMDFPFGIPAAFSAHLGVNEPLATMPPVWETIANMTFAEFLTARNNFVRANGELRRAGDARYYPESSSPLHCVNPNMVPMTYRGIKMLHCLHRNYPQRWNVPPLEPIVPLAADVTLLELMPGALLRAIGLNYRGYKNGQDAPQLRNSNLDNLAGKAGIELQMPPDVWQGCLANHDCLDAVIAAVGAAMWAQDSDRFRHPNNDAELAAAQLEGWIYAPCPRPRNAQISPIANAAPTSCITINSGAEAG